jgi:formate dehydrogenase subunit gamma
MHGNRGMRWLMRLIVLLCVAGLSQFASAADNSAQEQVKRQATQPGNNAPVWRDVRGGDNASQTTQVRGIETNVLVQSGGETWRQIRNGPITVYGGWLLVVITLLIGLYYGLKGQLKLHDKPTGRLMQRFSPWDRIVHWSTAISFVILAITGMVTLFGKYILLPVFGYTLFSWLAILSKNLHNFVGPLFAVCTVLLFITFVKDNFPKAHDWLWMRKAGGLLSGEHVPSDRFNAGEKIWFWFGVTLLGIVASVTGFILDFSNFGQGRLLMQQANVIHGIAAVLFVPMALAHIYIGTLGVEGAYESMRTGSVDETWAKEHHEYWYNDTKARQGHAPGGAPSAAVASAMKEGWK